MTVTLSPYTLFSLKVSVTAKLNDSNTVTVHSVQFESKCYCQLNGSNTVTVYSVHFESKCYCQPNDSNTVTVHSVQCNMKLQIFFKL